jgi:peroxiredoxin Q/BCP
MTNTRPKAASTGKARAAAAQAEAQRAERRRRLLFWTAGLAVAAIVAGGLYGVFARSDSGTAHTGYQVGNPGPGQAAPAFTLASSSGGTASLPQFKGKSVLLYFQEGLTCQPCWDQLTDLEKDAPAVKAAGIDQVVSVTTDPADLLARKVQDMGLHTTVLSDPTLAASRAYHANDFGMMGASRDGHTFVLVGPDGTIRWRADYGGSPDYTMYVKPAQLLADLRSGEKK